MWFCINLHTVFNNNQFKWLPVAPYKWLRRIPLIAPLYICLNLILNNRFIFTLHRLERFSGYCFYGYIEEKHIFWAWRQFGCLVSKISFFKISYFSRYCIDSHIDAFAELLHITKLWNSSSKNLEVEERHNSQFSWIQLHLELTAR